MRPQDVRKARETPGLSTAERLVLETLTDYASDDRGVWLPREDLARKTGLHPKTIQHAIRRLITLGYVDEMKRAQRGQTRQLMPRPNRWPSLLTPEAEARTHHHTDPAPDESSAMDALGW